MIAHHGLFDLEVVQQLQRHPLILCGDEIHRGEGFNGAGGEVAQIADGCGDKIKRTAHDFVFFGRYLNSKIKLNIVVHFNTFQKGISLAKSIKSS